MWETSDHSPVYDGEMQFTGQVEMEMSIQPCLHLRRRRPHGRTQLCRQPEQVTISHIIAWRC